MLYLFYLVIIIKENLLKRCVLFLFYFQIELEREEYLKLRLNIFEENFFVQQKESIRVDLLDEFEEEEEKLQLFFNMKFILKFIDVFNSVIFMFEDNDSNFFFLDEDFQFVYGLSKEENVKLGFGGFKLGMKLVKYYNLDGLLLVFLKFV